MNETVVAGAPPARKQLTVYRLAGFGGVGFSALIIVQNIMRGATAPPNNAGAAEILDYATGSETAILMALWPIGGILLLGFAAGLYHRVREGSGTALWAQLGLIGVALVAALFGVSNGFLAVLAASGDSLSSSPTLVETLWHLHAATFGLNMLGIGLALFGFARAAGAVGLVPRGLVTASQLGAVLMIVASGTAVQQVEGSPVFFVGLVGFLVWIVFVATTGVKLIRES